MTLFADGDTPSPARYRRIVCWILGQHDRVTVDIRSDGWTWACRRCGERGDHHRFGTFDI